MLLSSMLLLALTSISAPASQTDAPGPVQVLPCLSRERYDRIAAGNRGLSSFVAVREFPPLSDGTCYGINVIIGQTNVSWVIDGGKLHLDRNANGSLLDDPPVTLGPEGGKFRVDVPFTDSRGAAAIYPVEITARMTTSEGAPALQLRSNAVRQGTIDVGQGPVAFRTTGSVASFAQPALAFDLNGDGKFDADGPEVLSVWDDSVNLAGQSYGIATSPDGATLTLTPLGEKRPDRIRVQPGTRVPPVRVEDARGKSFTLPAAGTPVVLYFWTAHCGGWPDEAPKIAALNAIANRGYDLVGVNLGDDLASYEKALRQYDLGPRQVYDTIKGVLPRLFRVDVVPSYIVIDGDGVIRATRLESDDYHAEIRALIKQPA
ncbi:MAG TPA: TlpA disulfide reductase family protein [Thermoanaerobaculia bacterium]|jgi:hypothetical protein